MVSHSLSTTLLREEKHLFLKFSVRNSRRICSIGFISGVYGGMAKSLILSGIFSVFELCHDAPSQTNKITSSGYYFPNSDKNKFIHSVLHFGRIKKKFSPSTGSTAPYAYTYSRIRWQGTLGRIPFGHQHEDGVEIRPKPASS